MNRNRVFIGLLTLSLTALAALSAMGQRNMARNQVDAIVRNLETSSDVFSRDFKNRNTSTSERRIVDNFENAIDRLRRNFDRNDNWWSTRNDVQSIMDESQQVNQLMNNERFARALEVQWRNLRRDINALANTYELPGLGGGGGNWNGGGGGRGRGARPPSWAQGTFYARNPQNGGTITMTVAANGRVTLLYDGGSPTYAEMDGTLLQNGPYVSRVMRISNGIRTTDNSTGESIDYLRNPNWGGGGAGGNVPSWAVGRFRARNPQNGGNITMTVQRDGSVTLIYDGGSTVYATMNGTTLTNGPYVSRVTQIRNGIRTTDNSTGESINYYSNR
jgi:hypothetical protein